MVEDRFPGSLDALVMVWVEAVAMMLIGRQIEIKSSAVCGVSGRVRKSSIGLLSDECGDRKCMHLSALFATC